MTSRVFCLAVDCVDTAPLVSLGATVVKDEPDVHWVVMRDPGGNEFCVLHPRR